MKQKSEEAKTSKEAALSDTELDKVTGGSWLTSILERLNPSGHKSDRHHPRPIDRP